MRTTINDIARLAGVSKTTVSFAFNDPGRISADTRDRIFKIAEERGYVPDPIARTLSSRRLGTIGFLLPQHISSAFENRYMAEILRGLGRAFEPNGLSITVIPPMAGSLDKSARSAAVDGFVTLGLLPNTDTAQVIRHRHLPLVTIDGSVDGDIPNVTIRDFDAAFSVMARILELGHREIGIIDMGPVEENEREEGIDMSGSHYSGIAEQRRAGYEAALQTQGLSIEQPGISVVYREATRDGAYRAAMDLLDRSDRPSAIVAMSDLMAIGVYHAALKLGIPIPDELSVAGFDDTPEAELLSPPLSTLSQPGMTKGFEAGKMVLELLAGRTLETTTLFMETHFVERGSTAEPGRRPLAAAPAPGEAHHAGSS